MKSPTQPAAISPVLLVLCTYHFSITSYAHLYLKKINAAYVTLPYIYAVMKMTIVMMALLFSLFSMMALFFFLYVYIYKHKESYHYAFSLFDDSTTSRRKK